MIVEFFFDEKDRAILERIAKRENTDVETYFTKALKWQLRSNINSKHFREELLKLKEEYPVPDKLYQKKLKTLKKKYEELDEINDILFDLPSGKMRSDQTE